MSHRVIVDSQGTAWDVWAVSPAALERRVEVEVASESPAPERRRQSRRILVADALQDGWLAFQSLYEKRRLAPLPVGWSDASDETLREYLRRSVVVPARKNSFLDGSSFELR